MSVNLSAIGIEEVEPNVCADTAQNRAILRAHALPYAATKAGFVEVFQNREDSTKAMHDRNKAILKNPRNAWSDYVSFSELPLDFMEQAPAWMQRTLNKYNDAVDSGVPEHKLPKLPVRCARVRADGTRCWMWSWPSHAAEDFCRYHAPVGSFDYGAQFQKLTDAAKARLVDMQGPALAALEELLTDPTTVQHVRMKAVETVLDRTGLGAKQELSVSGTVHHEIQDPAQAVRERLNALAERLAPKELPESSSLPILDAELVNEETDDVPND